MTFAVGRRQRAAASSLRRSVLRTVHGPRCPRGFTLLELVVIISVIAILAAALTPAVLQQLVDSRIRATEEEARTLHEAIVGDHTQSRFGFVGDIGRLPNSFQELVQPGGLPNYTTSTTRNIGMGWRGPYVNTGTSAADYASDAFGRPYTGASTGQVRSQGPDGIAGNVDDIVYPPAAPAIAGNVTATVKTITQGKTVVDPSGYRVELFFAANGAQNTVADTGGPFNFTNVPMGIHAIRVVKTSNPNSGTVVSQDTIIVRPGSTTNVELWF
jgi:prepilin-type N-terminal cleavage/methylation domain-containing protein